MVLGSTKLPSENEYQEYPYAVVTKSGNLNFSEPSGPLQACNGTALPLYNYSSTNTRYCVYSFELLMMGGGTV